MIEIFKFYLNLVVKLFNQVLQKFEVTEGLGFGTFLLGCSLFVIFLNLLKFQFGTNGFSELKEYNSRRLDERARLSGKHSSYRGKHSK